MDTQYDIKNYSQDDLLLKAYQFLEQNALELILEAMKDSESDNPKHSICLKFVFLCREKQ